MNLLKKSLAALFILTAAMQLSAQKAAKFGHINANELLTLMPERKTAAATLDTLTKEVEKQIKELMVEYQAKVEDFEKKVNNMSDLIKRDKAEEIRNLENRIRTFQQEAENSLEAKQQELLEPILNKAKKAIEEVAKENGYTYIFDTSSGFVLFWEESDNILALVKKKLKL